jgi:alpha(1,3/1,4) fucosyltransferase
VVFCGEEKLTERERFPAALKIHVHHENRYPDFSRFHYAIGFRPLDHPRWFRWPLYARTCQAGQLVKDAGFVQRTCADRERFCTLVATNANPVRVWRRLEIAEKLARHKRVDFGGRYKNNVGGPVPDKITFYRSYRFAIAFENGGMRGHTTEKLTDAMIAGCIPIFWGNPDIASEFNPKSFVNAHEFTSLDDVVERVRQIDADEALYHRMLGEPWFHDNRPNAAFDAARLGAFLHRAIESPRPPLYAVYPPYRWFDWTRKLGFVADRLAGRLGIGIAGPV